MATYIDDQGFLTQDYTMDNSDVAAAVAASGGGMSRKGIPMMGQGTGMAMPGDTGSMWDPLDRLGANQNAVNTAARAATYNMPPSPMGAPAGAGTNVTSQPGAPLAGRPVPVGGIAPMMPGGVNPQVAAATQDNAVNNAINLSKLPANDLQSRASYTPGGVDLFNALSAAGHLGNAGQITPNSTLSGLTDADGKALPTNSLNKDMVTDPRFRAIEQQDQLYGTNNAATFYANMNPGRTLMGDRAAAQALQVSQATTRTKDAAELAKTLTVATKDIPGQGIYKGDLVTQQVVPSMLPGQDTTSILPLTTYQKELANMLPDTTTDASGKVTQVMDQYGRPSYSARGNSEIQKATGTYSVADLQYLQGLQTRKNNQNKTAAVAQAPAQATSGVAGVAPAGKATSLGMVDTGSLMYDNATTTLGNLVGSVTGTPAAPYTSPAQRLAEVNQSAVNAASVWGNTARGGTVTASPQYLADKAAAAAAPVKPGPKFDPYLFQNDDNYLPPSGR